MLHVRVPGLTKIELVAEPCYLVAIIVGRPWRVLLEKDLVLEWSARL